MNIQQKIAIFLREHNATLSVAESCTGGRISHVLTTVSGASAYYLGSVTSYSISLKEKILDVPSDIISSHGVVSSEVAASMAEGIRRITGSTYSVATTGLAEGGNDKYPEGTVWIAVSGPMGILTKLYQSGKSDRKKNILLFTNFSLQLLYSYLIDSVKALNVNKQNTNVLM